MIFKAIFIMWCVTVIVFTLVALVEHKKKRLLGRILAVIPLALVAVMTFHLNTDAGEIRTSMFNKLNGKFESFSAEKYGSSADGFSMGEYWMNKDLIDLYSNIELEQLRSRAAKSRAESKA